MKEHQAEETLSQQRTRVRYFANASPANGEGMPRYG